MKRAAYTMIALLVLVGSMAVAAQAQNSGRNEMRANIPFEFHVGNQTLTSGEYTVRQINPSSDRVVLQLRSQDGKSVATIQMNSVIARAPQTASLTFNRYGNQYFFAQAWLDGDSSGLEASKSGAERAAQSEMAGIKAKTQMVALRAR